MDGEGNKEGIGNGLLNSDSPVLDPNDKEDGRSSMDDIPIQGLMLDFGFPLPQSGGDLPPSLDSLHILGTITPYYVKDTFKNLSLSQEFSSENFTQYNNGLMDTLPLDQRRMFDKEWEWVRELEIHEDIDRDDAKSLSKKNKKKNKK